MYQRTLLTLALIFSSSSICWASDPWLPYEGRGSVTASYVFETFDTFWRGTDNKELPFGELDQHTWTLSSSYGLSDDLALDLSLGYTRTVGDDLGIREGLDDSRLGVRYKVIDEFEDTPHSVATLTLSTAALIAGSYDEDTFPIAPGDGANGVEFSALFGKILGDSGFGTQGEVGIQLREGSVPENLFVRAGAFYTFVEAVTLSAQYRREEDLSGIDIGSDGFSPSRSGELQERSDSFDFSLGYQDSLTGGYYSFLYSLIVDGRNIGEKDIFGASISFPF